MGIGLSLHIGLSGVNSGVYGSKMPLMGCVNDAISMAEIARQGGTTDPVILLNNECTYEKITTKIKRASGLLKAGDMFTLTYSGHGGQRRVVRSPNEPDGLNETWCLYDGPIVDDIIADWWKLFVKGVRILVISDSCHSGTVTDFRGPMSSFEILPLRLRGTTGSVMIKPTETIKASVLLLSGCQDDQVSIDGAPNSAFTRELLEVWNNGKFRGDYRDLHQQICQRLKNGFQHPNLYFTGSGDPEAFISQRPFKV